MCKLLLRYYTCRDRAGVRVDSRTHFEPRRLLIRCSAPLRIPLLEEDITAEAILPCLTSPDMYEQWFDYPCPDCRGEPKDLDPLPHRDRNLDGYLRGKHESLRLRHPWRETKMAFFRDAESCRADAPAAVKHMAETLAATMYYWLDAHWQRPADTVDQEVVTRHWINRDEAQLLLRVCVRNSQHRPLSPLFECGCHEMSEPQAYNVATAMRYDILKQTEHGHHDYYARIMEAIGDNLGPATSGRMHQAADTRTERLRRVSYRRKIRIKEWQDRRQDPDHLWRVEPFQEETIQARMRVVDVVLKKYRNLLALNNLYEYDVYKSPFSLAHAILRKMGEILAHDTGLGADRLQATMNYLATNKHFLRIRRVEKAEAVRRRVRAWPAWIANEHDSMVARLAGLINNYTDDWADRRHVGEFIWDVSFVYSPFMSNLIDVSNLMYWWDRESYPLRRKRINQYRLEHIHTQQTLRLRLQATNEYIRHLDYNNVSDDEDDVPECQVCLQNFTDNEPAFDTFAEPRACAGEGHWTAPRCLRLRANQWMNPNEPWQPQCAKCRKALVPNGRIAQAGRHARRLRDMVRRDFSEEEDMIAIRPRPGLVLEDWDQYGHPFEWVRDPAPRFPVPNPPRLPGAIRLPEIAAVLGPEASPPPPPPPGPAPVANMDEPFEDEDGDVDMQDASDGDAARLHLDGPGS